MTALEDLASPARADRYPDDLSGGDVSGSPSPTPWSVSAACFLADEPTGALDSVNSEAVMRLLRRGVSTGRGGDRRDP